RPRTRRHSCRCSTVKNDSIASDSCPPAVAIETSTAPTRPSRLPSVFGRNLEPRERRTIAIGATVVAITAIIMLVLVPLGRRWSEREALISVTRNHLARVESIVGHEAELAGATRGVESRLDA